MKWIVLVILMASCSKNMTPEKTWAKESQKYQDRKSARQIEKKTAIAVTLFVLNVALRSHFAH